MAAASTVTLEKTTVPLLEKELSGGGGGGGCCCGGRRRERKQQQQRKCELVGYDELPHFLRHNEFIRKHYRAEWPFLQTALSVFSVHNDTINIWTHLIGFFIFFSLIVGVAQDQITGATMSALTADDARANHSTFISMVVPSVQGIHNLSEFALSVTSGTVGTAPVTRWPLYVYLCGAMFCLLMSTGCHLLACHSELTNYIMLRLDYTGIAGLIVASFYPVLYYTFLCDPFFRGVYTAFISLFGAAAIAVSLMPVFETRRFLGVRAGLYVCMGLSGVVPMAHKMLLYGHRPEAMETTLYELGMGACYLVGVVIYTTRVPERWMPGKFDLAGHSHQFFHMLVVAGAYTHYQALLVYLRWRDADGCMLG